MTQAEEKIQVSSRTQGEQKDKSRERIWREKKKKP